MNDDPRIPSPVTLVIARHLPALVELEKACGDAGLYAECMIAGGLMQLLIDLVMSDTVPGTPEHEAAKAIHEAAL